MRAPVDGRRLDRPTRRAMTSMSIRFSLTQIGDTSPSGQLMGVKSRSSTTTSPFTCVMPDARTCGEFVERAQRVAGGLDRPGQAERGVAVVELGQVLVVQAPRRVPVRSPKLRSPEPTSTRLPSSVPPSTVPAR